MKAKLEAFIDMLCADELDPHVLIDALEDLVNNFSLDVSGAADAMLALTGEAEAQANNVVMSCVYALGHAWDIDARNEIAAERCGAMESVHNPYEAVADEFLRVHHTLQQAAMAVFFKYIDARYAQDAYKNEDMFKDVPALCEEFGEWWYDIPANMI